MGKSSNTKKSANAPKPKTSTSTKKSTSTSKSAPKPAKKASSAKSANTRKAVSRSKPEPEKKPLFHKRTIAERTVAFKTANWRAIVPWFVMAFFLLLAGFFEFVVVGYSFSALVCLCLTDITLFYTVMPHVRKKYPRFGRTVSRIFTVILCIGLLVVGITEGIVIHASFGNPDEQIDYLVVLGAGVHGTEPSLSLRNRIDAAYEYLTANPDVTAVLSGGMGDGENISEAQCMFDHLTAMGIAPDRLWMEDQSASTWMNLNYSLNLIEEKTGTRPGKIGVLSSEYHLFRASLFTKECGTQFVGVPAKTTKISLRINYFMREAAGVWHYLLLGGQYT